MIFTGLGNPPVATSTTTAPNVKPKALTKAEQLSAALKACKKKPKRERVACEKQARKRYAPAKKKAKKAKKTNGKGGARS
jgi:hypothetical protein